jgi:hypothetical protein
MTEDPRIAAMAEALFHHGAAHPDQFDQWEWDSCGPECAAAILAALPDDWCGHTAWRHTDTFNVWTGTCGHLWLATTGPDCPTCAEIAGLRIVLDAVRRVQSIAPMTGLSWEQIDNGIVVRGGGAEMIARLRAALDGLVDAADALVAAENRYMDPNDGDNTADGLVEAEEKFRVALAAKEASDG